MYVSLCDFACLVLLLPFGLGFYLFGFFPDVSPHLFIHGEFGFTLYQNCMLPPLTVSLSLSLVCASHSLVSVFLRAPLAW